MIDATPLLRLYARRRAAALHRQDPAATQRRQLLRLVRRARDTRFGRDHDFAGIRDVADFQARVPIRRYEAFWSEYWEPTFPHLAGASWPGAIPYFALTSGTTSGKTKYVPVSREMIASNKWAAFDLLTFHVRNRPTSRVLGGKNFMLGGSTALSEEAPGIHSGDLSGIAAAEVPRWAEPFYFPPRHLALIADWEQKIETVGRLSLAEDIRTLGGTASWLLLFFDKLAAMRGDDEPRIARLYPNLELLVHGGVNFGPYRARFERLLEGSHAELREVYPASEGFIAIADRGTGEGLRMLLDIGIFYEFVPAEELDGPAPRRFWAADIEPGVNYAVVMSTCAGAWAYLLGDTVRFVETRPPRLLVTGRISYMLSAFGEHLIGEEIEAAVAAAAAAIGAEIADYSVGPVYPERAGETGGHLYVVEFAGEVPGADRIDAFARAVDAHLADANPDYRDHRAGGFGMAPPRVQAVPPGTFAAWMHARGRLGGQNKVPRIITDGELFASLRAAAAGAPG